MDDTTCTAPVSALEIIRSPPIEEPKRLQIGRKLCYQRRDRYQDRYVWPIPILFPHTTTKYI